MGMKEKMAEMMMGNMTPEQKKEMMDFMMGKFFENMNSEEKQKMMEDMMDKFMNNMKPEEKQAMMQNMMSKMMGSNTGNSSNSGNPMMNMMSMMMSGMKGDNNMEMPWDMCKKMMNGISNASETATFATPEIRSLFDEWAVQIEDEILKYIQESGIQDAAKISEKFKLSIGSINYFLTRLSNKGKINLKAEKNP